MMSGHVGALAPPLGFGRSSESHDDAGASSRAADRHRHEGPPDRADANGDIVSDEELALRMFAGDDLATRSIIERYRHQLFGMLVRLCRDRDLADELFQETFLRALRASKTFDRSRRFKPWLFTIAVNLTRDRLTRLGHRATPRVTFDGELPETRPNHGEQESNLRGRDVREAVGQLSDAHREVIVLRYFEDLDEGEIAQAAGIPRGTVKSRLHHAVRKLRELLQEP